MELPTYTSIWRIEKRLYKLYDFRLPMPLPVGQIAVFAAITIPYVLLLTVFGLPFNHTLFWLYVLPPGVLTWLATRPVLESKRLPELVSSQLRYLGEPSSWCRMAALAERDEVAVYGRVWRRREAEIAAVAEAEEDVAVEESRPDALPVAHPEPAQPGRARPKRARPERGRPERGRPELGRPEEVEPERARPERGRAGAQVPAWLPRQADGSPAGGRVVPPARARHTAQRQAQPRARGVAGQAWPGAAREARPGIDADVLPGAAGEARPGAAGEVRPGAARAGTGRHAAGWPEAARLGAWSAANGPNGPADQGPSGTGGGAGVARAGEAGGRADAGAVTAAPVARWTDGGGAGSGAAAGRTGAGGTAAGWAGPGGTATGHAGGTAAGWPAGPRAASGAGWPVTGSETGGSGTGGSGTGGSGMAGAHDAGAASVASGNGYPAGRHAASDPSRSDAAGLIPAVSDAGPVLDHQDGAAHDAAPVVTPVGPRQRPLTVERALGRPGARGGTGWRSHVMVVPGGQGPGRPDPIREARARAVLPLDRPGLVVVLGCTVGAGQTVTALMLADLLANLRGEPVAALDLNPGPASLTELAGLPAIPVSALVGPRAATGQPAHAAPRRGQGQRGPRRADVVCDDPAGEGSWTAGGLSVAGQAAPARARPGRLFEFLAGHYGLTVADPGAVAVTRVLPAADQLVLVAPASPDAARAVGMTMEWLGANGHGALGANCVTVLNGVSQRSVRHAEQAEVVVRGRVRAIVRVPWDYHLAGPEAERGSRENPPGHDPAGEDAPSRLDDLRPAVLAAYTALAGVVVSSLASGQQRGRAAR